MGKTQEEIRSQRLGCGLSVVAAGCDRERRGLVFAGELFEGLALGLGDEEGGEAAEQHEQGVDLENVVHPRVGVLLGGAVGSEDGDGTLADDGADLAGGGRDTVGGGSVSGGEHLTGNDECSHVRTEVEEELGKNVDGQQSVAGNVVVRETHDDEKNG